MNDKVTFSQCFWAFVYGVIIAAVFIVPVVMEWI